MAAPTYTHDLTDLIADSDTSAWGELANAISGGAPDEADTESALQGTNSCSQSQNTTGLCSMCRILGTPVTLSAGQVFLVWHGHGVATSLLSYSSGGLRLAVATDLNNWKAWSVGGNDVAPFPYAKWVNNPVDPTVTTDYTNGTPPTGGSNIYGVGSMSQLSAAVAKGQPHIVDIIRYGRAEARIYGGESGNYANFAGFAALNDVTSARWGLIQATTGGYLWKGLMTLGYSTAVNFVDSNKNVFVQDTRKVSSGFNKIEIRQATSVVSWTNISLSCLSPTTTASKGAVEVIDNANVDFDNCTFTDLDTFIFLSNSTIVDTTFRRCGQVTGGGAAFNTCTFTNSTAAVSLVLTNLNQTTGCTFVSDGSNHAVDLGTISSSTSMNWNNNLTGYAVSDGSTGNEAIKVNVATSQTLTINVGTGYSTPSVYNTGSGTVSVVSGQVTTSITVKDLSTGSVIQGANVLVWVIPTINNYFYQASVSITGSGTTATVTQSGHGLATGDYVIIEGVTNDDDYNGVFQVNVTNSSTYTYTATETLGASPATGSPTATFALISGTTDANGQISDTRTLNTQDIQGWARKSSSSPYYQQGAISGTVDSGSGLSVTVQLARDE